MQLGAKEQVLLALYLEYQKDLPDMAAVNNTDLNMDIDVFNIALDKLQNEEYIRGFASYPADNNKFYCADLSRVMLTKSGLDYVENCFGIAKEQTSADKVRYVIRQCGIYGYKALKDIGKACLAAAWHGMLYPET